MARETEESGIAKDIVEQIMNGFVVSSTTRIVSGKRLITITQREMTDYEMSRMSRR